MTLTSTDVRVQYDGDDSTIVFPVTYVFWGLDDLEVVLQDASGAETAWTRGTQYTLTGGDGAIGTLTAITSPTDYTPATGETLTIKSALPNTQPTDIPLGGKFSTVPLEQQLDQIVRQGQQRDETLDRSLKYPISDLTSLSSEIPASAERAGKLLGFDGGGEPDAIVQSDQSATSVTPTDRTTSRLLAIQATLAQGAFFDVTDPDYGATGNGSTDDTVAIQAAITAVEAVGGGLLYFPPGTYKIEEVSLPSNIQVFAALNTVTITKAIGGTNNLFKVLSQNNVTISGLIFDGKRSAGGGVSGSALYAETVDNLVIERCKYYDAININLAQGVTNVRIVNNWLIQGLYGIAIGTVSPFAACADVIIANNYIEDMSTEAIDVNQNAQRVTIQANVLFNNHSDANGDEIDIGGNTTAPCSDIAVLGNVIDNNGNTETGIKVKLDTDRFTIIGNVVRNGDTADVDGRGIYVTQCTNGVVSGNIIDGFTRGITCADTSKDVAIGDNVIENVAVDGIQVGGTGNERIAVTGNNLLGTGATGQGCNINGVTDFVVNGNFVSDFDGDGIILANTCDRGQCNHNNVQLCDDGIVIVAPSTTLVGNQVHNNQDRGIAINADHVVATGNEAFDNNTAGANYGITLETGADFCIVNDNKSYDSRAGGARTQDGGFRIVGACDRCVVQGNIFYNNITTQIAGTGVLTNSVYVATDNVIS